MSRVDDDTGAQVQAALTRLLRWSSRAASLEEMGGPAAAGLTPTDLWLLDGVLRFGPVRASDLAGWQGVDRSTITVQLRRLEERELVVRTPDPDDGRVVLLTASPAGERVMADVVDHGARALQGLMTGWNATDRRRFAALFDRFTAGMDPTPPRH